MRSPGRWLVPLVLLAVAGSACGDDDDGSGASSSASPPPSLASVDQWCEAYAEVLPAATPNPDGRELEVLDLQIARAETLAAGAPGVPPETVAAAGDVLAGIVGMRQRVADGEALPDVLQDVYADPDSPFMVAGQAVDDGAAEICP